MSTTMVARLLDLANAMIEDNPRSSAVHRRAVSTAYYAAFHALVKTCAETLLPGEDRTSELYERAYRAIDHKPMRGAFESGKSKNKPTPLGTIPTLREIGDLIVPLQSARIQADYAPPRTSFYRGAEARDFVASARRIVELLGTLDPEQRRTLATYLILKDRQP